MIFKYEHKHQKLASRRVFVGRIAKNLLLAIIIMAVCLFIGIIGFHTTCNNVSWLNAFHNSAMLLSGMGPVLTDLCTPGIWFSSFYALFGGIVFITNIGIILAPAIHRLFHKLHIEEK
jgi:hypothetical protein